MTERSAAPRNRTLRVTSELSIALAARLVKWPTDRRLESLVNTTVLGDSLTVCQSLPNSIFDLIVADPPYNLSKDFRSTRFSKRPRAEYTAWLDGWLSQAARLLKPAGTLYVCSEWQSSGAIQEVCERYFVVRNRITWEREKGRGAARNWKNSSEDIWFCTVSDDYYFDVDAVKVKRRVIAPYRDPDGAPRDWTATDNGNFRITHPSNLWTDITVPFWSMPENTEHPTQKPEKLIAKLILASSRPGDLVFDPFLGSGTTSVVAKKLGRRYLGVEQDEHYACLAEMRLTSAEINAQIQGYTDGVFWERNTLAEQGRNPGKSAIALSGQPNLFNVQS
ncbi:MAG: site-specific DNA-methyltransferase [Chloroflexi bacterium]|nr:site-specific DNA-methyltransferase [Chloroflexota bacterium]